MEIPLLTRTPSLLEAVSPRSGGVRQSSWYLGVEESSEVYAYKISERSQQNQKSYRKTVIFFV